MAQVYKSQKPTQHNIPPFAALLGIIYFTLCGLEVYIEEGNYTSHASLLLKLAVASCVKSNPVNIKVNI